MQGVPVQQENTWTTDICGCCEDPANCCITWCCPCITFGQIAEILDRGETTCGRSGCLYAILLYVGFQWIYSFPYRQKLRSQYMLPESPCADCCVHYCYCCHLCALCQEYRELQNRGFDVVLGWDGNMQRMGAGGQMNAPPVQGGMAR